MSYWQVIFTKSKVNGALYDDDALPIYNWNWPTDTYLRRRRSHRESLAAADGGRYTAGKCYK
ncbi:MAG TPA: hypothetical protein VMT22_06940 [Terriglobales bacterium]|jgi:hypothetical protein|nr:hypothetical protein [Terriglobales bacterium]